MRALRKLGRLYGSISIKHTVLFPDLRFPTCLKAAIPPRLHPKSSTPSTSKPPASILQTPTAPLTIIPQFNHNHNSSSPNIHYTQQWPLSLARSSPGLSVRRLYLPPSLLPSSIPYSHFPSISENQWKERKKD